MFPSNDHVCASASVEICFEFGRVDRLMRLRVKSVPAQNVISRAPNKDVYKNVGELFVTTFDQSKVILQVWWIDREISFVILVKKLDLIVNVPCAFVARCRRQKAAALTRRKKRLENSI